MRGIGAFACAVTAACSSGQAGQGQVQHASRAETDQERAWRESQTLPPDAARDAPPDAYEDLNPAPWIATGPPQTDTAGPQATPSWRRDPNGTYDDDGVEIRVAKGPVWCVAFPYFDRDPTAGTGLCLADKRDCQDFIRGTKNQTCKRFDSYACFTITTRTDGEDAKCFASIERCEQQRTDGDGVCVIFRKAKKPPAVTK